MNLKKALEVIGDCEIWTVRNKEKLSEMLTALASPHDAIQEFHVGGAVRYKDQSVDRSTGRVIGFDSKRGWPLINWQGTESKAFIDVCCAVMRDPSKLEVFDPVPVVPTPPSFEFHVGDVVKDLNGHFSGKGGVESFNDKGWPRIRWHLNCPSCPSTHNPATLEVISPATPTPPPFKFEVGDFVRVVEGEKGKADTTHYNIKEIQGLAGRIVGYSSNEEEYVACVEFNEKPLGGWDCEGCAAPKHGRWVNMYNLELIDRPRR